MKKPNLKIHDREKLAPEEILFYADQCHTPRQFSNLMRRLQSCIPFRNLLCCLKNAMTYEIAHVADLDFPEKFQQWYLKADMIEKDPAFNECLRTQQCQIWTDLFRRMPHRFDREYIRKVKEFKLEHTMSGVAPDIPNELIFYVCLTMGSEKECHDYIKTFADVLPALCKAMGNAYGRRPPFRPPVLTERQKHVLQLTAEGGNRRAVARKLGITERTVQMHLATIRRKLHAKNKTHAVSLAIRYKLIG